VENSDNLVFITMVQLLFTSMNLTVLLLPFERLGLVDSWRMNYDQKSNLEGLITLAP
jgi:hypothetical protein